MSESKAWRPWRTLVSGCGLLAVLGSVGCQVDIGGQVLPSPYWQTDDVQYFPPGPEFKLSREAAAMKQYQQEQLQSGQPIGPAPAEEVVPAIPGGPVPEAVVPDAGVPAGAAPAVDPDAPEDVENP